jgi:hypothetical protein
MAVSGKTADLQIPYYLGTDKPPDMAAVTKAMADKIESTFVGASSQLLIVQDTGAPAAKAMKGDATLAKDGTLAIADAVVTSRKTKLTIESKVASGNLALTEAFQDLPGTPLEITPLVASTLFLVATFRMLAIGGATAHGTVRVGEVDQTDEAFLTPEAAKTVLASVAQIYTIPLTAAKHTIALCAKRTGGGSGECLTGKFAGFLVAS